MRILKEDTAGLIVDIQERLFPHIYENEQIEKNTNILIQGLKLLEIPILVTEQYRKGLGLTIPTIADALGNGSTIEKMSFSCCDNEGFESELRNLSRQNIIIAGIESHVCVLQTTVDLIESGFRPIVVEDCVSSRKEKDKKIAIERMRQEGALITSYESILFELARISGTDTFKAISKLVK
jgi:nicotinamidase-related amidase